MKTARSSTYGLLAGMIVALCGCLTTPTPEPTPSPFPFVTATARPASTPPPTESHRSTSIPTAAPTLTPSPAFTFTYTPTATASPTPRLTVTILGTCEAMPDGIFRDIYSNDPGLPSSLGCVLSAPGEAAPRIWQVETLIQPFEYGMMILVSPFAWMRTPSIYALRDDQTYTRIDGRFVTPTPVPASTPPPPVPTGAPPESLVPAEPFLPVWRGLPGLSTQIGFASASPASGDDTLQVFQFGEMLYLEDQGEVIVLKRGLTNTWSAYPVNP